MASHPETSIPTSTKPPPTKPPPTETPPTETPSSATPSSATHPETQYLDGIRAILADGEWRDGRNGRVCSLPGLRMEFDLHRGVDGPAVLPLLTSKRVFWKGVREELLWLLSGSTYAPDLSARGVKIWDANASRTFLNSRGLRDNVEGDLGPIYGFQWRHWGARYRGVFDPATGDRVSYAGEGIDQMARAAEALRTDPFSRRIVVNAWNVADLDAMALPPCHMFMQFHVSAARGLTTILYQRSGDWGLGVPFNIASYAALTHMMAHVTGHRAHKLIHIVGDAHIYEGHVDALRAQLDRPLAPFPTFEFDFPEGAPPVTTLDDFRSEHFVIKDYVHAGALAMDMVA